MYQNSLIKQQKWQLFHTLVFSQVFWCSYYQQVNATTVKFRKFWDSTCGISETDTTSMFWMSRQILIMSVHSPSHNN